MATIIVLVAGGESGRLARVSRAAIALPLSDHRVFGAGRSPAGTGTW